MPEISTAFGSLAFFASYRDAPTGNKLHRETFTDWIRMTPEQQKRDLARYLAEAKQGLERLNAEALAPVDASPKELEAIARSLESLHETRSEAARPVPDFEMPMTAPLERVA